MSKIKIAVDAGHGSNTSGKRTCKLSKDCGAFKKGQQIHEHWINTYICVRLTVILQSMGYSIYKSAWDDKYASDDPDVALSARQAGIKKAKCNYSVSVHQNASGGGVKWDSGQGTEVLIHNNTAKDGDSMKMAESVLKELVKGSPQKNRGVKTQELAMCNCSSLGTKASILVECAFMTNQHETEDLLADPDFWDECAKEIATGIDNYIKSVSTKK
jgi:N-acetylmuramoyl-L-alanine amidase